VGHWERFFPLDINGDGKTDLLARDAAGNLIVWLSDGYTLRYNTSIPTRYTDADGWTPGIASSPWTSMAIAMPTCWRAMLR